MKTQEAVDHFGGRRYLAIAAGVSVQAVYKWGENVPAHHIERITGLMQSAQRQPQIEQSQHARP
jgi:D-tyrosyl-tRNA(Tyr) deacylase